MSSISGALSAPTMDADLFSLRGSLPVILSLLGDTGPDCISSVGYDLAYEVNCGMRSLLAILEYPQGSSVGSQARLKLSGGGLGKRLEFEISYRNQIGYQVVTLGTQNVTIFPVRDLLIPGMARVIAKFFDFGDPDLPPTDGERHYLSKEYCCTLDCCYGITGGGRKIRTHSESCRKEFLQWERRESRKGEAAEVHQKVLYLLRGLTPEDLDFVFKSIVEYGFTAKSPDRVVGPDPEGFAP